MLFVRYSRIIVYFYSKNYNQTMNSLVVGRRCSSFWLSVRLCEQNQVLPTHLQYRAAELMLPSNNWPKALLQLVFRSISRDSNTSGQTRCIILVHAYQMCLLWPVIGFRGDTLWLYDYICQSLHQCAAVLFRFLCKF